MSETIDVDRLVIFPELSSLFGIQYSRIHLARLEKTGKFPKRIFLSTKRVAWRASELMDWMNRIGKMRTFPTEKSTKPVKSK